MPLYNVFQRAATGPQPAAVPALGPEKKPTSPPISSRDFAHLPAPAEATAGPAAAARLAASPAFEHLSAAGQASLLAFDAQGFAVLSGFFSADEVGRH